MVSYTGPAGGDPLELPLLRDVAYDSGGAPSQEGAEQGGGLGQLTDGVIGETNFKANLGHGKGQLFNIIYCFIYCFIISHSSHVRNGEKLINISVINSIVNY